MQQTQNIRALHNKVISKGTWWQRLRRTAQKDSQPLAMYVPWILPNWLITRGLWVYVAALIVVTLMYWTYSSPWYYMLSGMLSVLAFFAYGSNISRRLTLRIVHKSILFEHKIFGVAFMLRLVWMLLIYAIFMDVYGDIYGFEYKDSWAYHEMGILVARMLGEGDYNFYDAIMKKFHFGISDMGYGTYVGFVYYLTNNSVIAVRLLKCVWSSLTVLLIYRLASRHFSPQVARIAAIFCALWPNFWYYCGIHRKEVEMVFLVVLFVEQADQMLRSRQFTLWKIFPLLLIVAALSTIRTVAALLAILALLFSVVVSSSRVVSRGKRIIIGVITVAMIAVSMGDRILQDVQQLSNEQQSGKAQRRYERKASVNTYAKYAGAVIFAPIIFTIPFPTMVSVSDQQCQQLLNGGNYLKNMMSFFVIMSMFIMLFSGSWRNHTLPLAFMLGYLFVLIMSEFPHSERFHQPAMPFEFMFAAYGLSIVMSNKKYQRWFCIWCILVFFMVVAWNWSKLSGRGLV